MAAAAKTSRAPGSRAWMNYSRSRRYRAASDRDPAKVGRGHDVNPVSSRLVNQAMPDRDPAHDLGKDHDEDERQERLRLKWR